MAVVVVEEEPILSRIDRLDHLVLKQLEEIRGLSRSAKSSSGLSTPSSWTVTSDGHSDDTSPRSMEKRCRPINHVIMETEVKGTLVERLDLVESRIAKMEEEMVEAEKKGGSGNRNPRKKNRWFTKLLKWGGGAKHRPASDASV